MKFTNKTLRTRIRENPRQFLLDFISDFKLSVSRISSKYERDRDIVNKVQNGAYEIDDVYDDRFMEELTEYIEGEIDKDENVMIRKEEGVEIRRDLVVEKDEYVEEIQSTPEIQRAVRSYFGTDFETSMSLALRYKNISEDELKGSDGLTRDWHIDTDASKNEVRLLLFLSEHPDGNFEVIDRESTSEILEKHGYKEVRDQPDLIDKSKVKSYGGEKGISVLSDVAHQLHRGKGPKENSRLILLLTFKPRTAILPKIASKFR